MSFIYNNIIYFYKYYIMYYYYIVFYASFEETKSLNFGTTIVFVYWQEIIEILKYNINYLYIFIFIIIVGTLQISSAL